MRVLFLAPQPFFQERGTPIALKLLLEALATSPKNNLEIDLLTYAEGQPIELPGVTHLRTPAVKPLTGIRPGISLKKLLYDLIFLFSAVRLVIGARKSAPYQLIHTVEEAVFIGWLFNLLFGIPFVYDMDSSLSKQLTEKWAWLAPVRWLFEKFENIAIRSAIAVIPVCGALERQAIKAGAKKIVMLRDVPISEESPLESSHLSTVLLRQQYAIPADQILGLYVGNLEFYQGIELLVEAFSKLPNETNLTVVVVGGPEAKAREMAEKIGQQVGPDSSSRSGKLIFTGPQPLCILPSLLKQADILISPRLVGNNTPMKIYSYLASGKAIVATDIESHTDVLNATNSLLAPTQPGEFANALLTLVKDQTLREKLGAQALLESQSYSYSQFKSTVTAIYTEIAQQLNLETKTEQAPTSPSTFDLAS